MFQINNENRESQKNQMNSKTISFPQSTSPFEKIKSKKEDNSKEKFNNDLNTTINEKRSNEMKFVKNTLYKKDNESSKSNLKNEGQKEGNNPFSSNRLKKEIDYSQINSTEVIKNEKKEDKQVLLSQKEETFDKWKAKDNQPKLTNNIQGSIEQNNPLNLTANSNPFKDKEKE